MTLIIGVKSKDGIVIGSDSKIIRGGEVTFDNKIFEKNNTIFAVEGLTGIRDDFLLLLDNEIKNRRGIGTLYEMKVIVEDIIAVLVDRYSDRLGPDSQIGALMSGLENINSGAAKLYYIHGVGYGEQTNFLCSGHGGEYATSIAKFLCNRNLSVDENAKLVSFVISWISEDVDTTVGGDPTVKIIRDENIDIELFDSEIVQKMVEKAKTTKENLYEIFEFKEKLELAH